MLEFGVIAMRQPAYVSRGARSGRLTLFVRHPVKFVPFIIQISATTASVALLGCHSSAISSLDGGQIRQILISKGQGPTISIDSRNEFV